MIIYIYTKKIDEIGGKELFAAAMNLLKENDDYYTKEIFDLIVLASDQGNSDAQYELGRFYENGCFVERNPQKALQYYVLSANQGNASAQSYLGWFYRYGDGIDPNLEKAIHYLTMAVNQGDTHAQYQMAICFHQGYGVDKDENKATEYFIKAFDAYKAKAENGDCLSRERLGDYYYNGYGLIQQDINKAIEHWIIAAEQGNLEVQLDLGDRFETGFDVDQDFGKAIYFYSLANIQKSPEALERLELYQTKYLFITQVLKQRNRLFFASLKNFIDEP